MTRKEFMTIFDSFLPEDKLFIVKHIQKQVADAMEEIADIAAYEKAKKKPGKSIPFGEAFREIEAHHSKQALR